MLEFTIGCQQQKQTFLSLEAAINLGISYMTTHTYRELSVARATLVLTSSFFSLNLI